MDRSKLIMGVGATAVGLGLGYLVDNPEVFPVIRDGVIDVLQTGAEAITNSLKVIYVGPEDLGYATAGVSLLTGISSLYRGIK